MPPTRTKRRPSKTAIPRESPPPPPPQVRPAPRGPVLNEVTLDALIAGDADFLDALIEEILFTAEAQIERIEPAIAQGRPIELRLLGETLRMAGEMVGAPRFTDAARAIADLGKSGAMGGAMDALAGLKDEFARMTAALRAYAERHAA